MFSPFQCKDDRVYASQVRRTQGTAGDRRGRYHRPGALRPGCLHHLQRHQHLPRLHRLPCRLRRPEDVPDAQHHAPRSPRLLAHGHRHRERDGHRHGAAWRHRHHSRQLQDVRRPGRRGLQGQALQAGLHLQPPLHPRVGHRRRPGQDQGEVRLHRHPGHLHRSRRRQAPWTGHLA
uniref:Uncharacterized protein n=1 Tax=Steinernema glaseri TaxID=37863 RepID=A0A1I7YE40_9BILA